MTERIAHRYAQPFLAACGARPPMTCAPDEAKVTCRDCKALPVDHAAAADRDQFAAALRDVLTEQGRQSLLWNEEGQ